MQLRRQGATLSPLREVYGAVDGALILPLDLCLIVQGPGGEQAQFPTSPGTLVDDEVVDTGGGVVGHVANYDWPPATAFDVKPIVRVTPTANVALPSARANPIDVGVGETVELQTIDGNLQSVASGATGTVTGPMVLRAWPDLSRRVQTYRVDFGQHLFPTSHGARVVVRDGGRLLGMLLFTQNQADGTCHAFVYPAQFL